MQQIINIICWLLTIVYPLTVYVLSGHFQPWQIALFLMLIFVIRLLLMQERNYRDYFLIALSIVFFLLAIHNNNLMTLRFYPVLINLILFILFFSSLFFSRTLVERLARLQHPELPPKGVAYTRQVTKVWSGFFLVNGCIALFTALYSNLEWWSLYNGVISYTLMGLLVGVEYLIRIRTQEHVR